MAKSKFLEYQDKNNDGLIDVCDEPPVVFEQPGCPDCKANAAAIVPDWKTQKDEEPWFNGRDCIYETTVTTAYTATIPDADATDKEAEDFIDSVFEEYAESAIETLLIGFNKKTTSSFKYAIKSKLSYKSYDLDARPYSHLKLLYSISYDNFAPLEEKDPTDTDEDIDVTDPTPVDVVILEDVKNLKSKLSQIQTGLLLFDRYYKVYRAVDKGNLVFENTGKIFDLGSYGATDSNSASGSLIKIFMALDKFLNSKGVELSKVTRLVLTAAPNAGFKKIEAYVNNAAAPHTFKDKSLRSLNANDQVKDPIALGYFLQTAEMHRALTARSPMNWKDFVKTFTTGGLSEKTNYRLNDPMGDGSVAKSTLSFVSKALEREGKQLGQDIFDSAFGIGDAIFYKFHSKTSKDQDETAKEREALGLEIPFEQISDQLINKVKSVKEKNSPGINSTLEAFAKEQAYSALSTTQMSFQEYVENLADLPPGAASAEEIFNQALDRIKKSGLQALLLETIENLMQGVLLEDALQSIVKSALSSMSVRHFGILFNELPTPLRDRITSLAEVKLLSGTLFKDSKLNQTVLNQMIANYQIVLPWEDPDVLNDSTIRCARTLAINYDLGESNKKINPQYVMQAYNSAIVEVFDDDLLSFIDYLNKFPGAPLIANTIATLKSPFTTMLEPSVVDFIKDVDLPPFRGLEEISLPNLQNPFGWIPSKMDISAILFEAALLVIQKAIMEIIIKIMVKISGIIGSASYRGLSLDGNLLGTLPSPDNIDQFTGTVRDAICGLDASEEEVNDTIQDILETLGPGAEAFANQEEAIRFTQDISSACTRTELTEALLGNPSDTFLDIIDSLIEWEWPELREGLSNKDSIDSFFTNTGALFPADVRDKMETFANQLPQNDQKPANPSLCADPAALENFCQLREQLLEGRTTSTQAKAMCESLQDDIKDNLEELGNMMQDPSAQIGDNMPPVVSDPGCDNGIFPFEPEEAVAAATSTIMNAMEQLKIDYVNDIMGDGGRWFGRSDSDWGLLNMILSDTYGNPLTAHNEKTGRSLGPTMDFTTNEPFTLADKAVAGNPYLSWMLYIRPMPTLFQISALPLSVGEWMRDQIRTAAAPGTLPVNGTFSFNNDWQKDETYYRTFRELGFTGFFGDDVDLSQIPDQGYNSKFRVNFEKDQVQIVRAGRKATPDFSMTFYDNCKGRKKNVGMGSRGGGGLNTFDYGFQMDMFLSDLHKEKGTISNIKGNNVRMTISDLANLTAPGDLPSFFSLYNPLAAADNVEKMFEALANPNLPDITDSETKYEFFAIDNTFDNVDLTQYPKLMDSFESTNEHPPQLILLAELIEQQNNISVNPAEIGSDYTATNQAIMGKLRDSITDDHPEAYEYGAAFDNLTLTDFDYLAPMEYQTQNSNTHRAREGVWVTEYEVDAGGYTNQDTGYLGYYMLI